MEVDGGGSTASCELLGGAELWPPESAPVESTASLVGVPLSSSSSESSAVESFVETTFTFVESS